MNTNPLNSAIVNNQTRHIVALQYTPKAWHIKNTQFIINAYDELRILELRLQTLESRCDYKYDPNQPRVPSGNPDGGQWSGIDGNLNNARPENKKPNINEAIDHLRRKAKPTSQSACAAYVRRALNAGGFHVKPPNDGGHGYAKNFGSSLEAVGFSQIAVSRQPANYPAVAYKPLKGDVAVIQNTTRGPAGHMAMYDGQYWISDFLQSGFWPGRYYRDEKPSYVIYRYPN